MCFFLVGCPDALTRIADAENQLQDFDSAKSSDKAAEGNADKNSGFIVEVLATDKPPMWLIVVSLVWHAVIVLQSFLAFGTAYRKAKAGGDSGVSLFGWLFVYNLAAIVPGLGAFLWKKSKG